MLTMIVSSKLTLLKLIGEFDSERMPTTMNFSPRRVKVLPIGSIVPKSFKLRSRPMTADFKVPFLMKVPDFRFRPMMSFNSSVVPRTLPDSTVRSPMRVLVLMASGAAAMTGYSASRFLSALSFSILSTSFRERFDLLK